MPYIPKFSKEATARIEQFAQQAERNERHNQQIERSDRLDSKIDYDTPVSKNECIGLLKDAQRRSNDSHLQAKLQQEIRHVKENGTNSGLKR